MDYLLRDAYHAGVEYGRYDWRRMVATVRIVTDPESGAPKIGVSEDGRHAAEAMIIARYMMFNQVYFHKTRVILDYHLQAALREMLPGGKFTPPIGSGISEYLKWDDWRVLGNLLSQGGEHGTRLFNRDFFRGVWQTPEFPTPEDEAKLNEVESRLGTLIAARIEASKSWYKVGGSDLLVFFRKGDTRPLSLCSTIVGNMEPSQLTRLYVRSEDRNRANGIIDSLG